MDEMQEHNFYKREFKHLEAFFLAGESVFLLKQLGMPKAKIASRLGISIMRVDRYLDDRNQNLIKLRNLTDTAARRDPSWPFNPAKNPAIS